MLDFGTAHGNLLSERGLLLSKILDMREMDQKNLYSCKLNIFNSTARLRSPLRAVAL